MISESITEISKGHSFGQNLRISQHGKTLRRLT